MNQPSIADIINAAPKQFCDNVTGVSNAESFFMVMQSGQTASVFVFTPSHLKKLSQWVSHQVNNYEKQFGEIKAEWNPNIPSPLKPSDIKNPPEEEE